MSQWTPAKFKVAAPEGLDEVYGFVSGNMGYFGPSATRGDKGPFSVTHLPSGMSVFRGCVSRNQAESLAELVSPYLPTVGELGIAPENDSCYVQFLKLARQWLTENGFAYTARER